MQSRNRILDDMARVASGALGTATGLRGEVEALVRERLKRALGDMELVDREEFEAVKAMAAKARTEQEKLAATIEVLQAEIAALKGVGGKGEGGKSDNPAKSGKQAPRKPAVGKKA